MGFVLLFAWAGHIVLFTLPALAGVIGLWIVHRKGSAPRPPFWPLVVSVAVLALAARLALFVQEPMQAGKVGAWEATFAWLYNVPLVATWALALLAFFGGRLAAAWRPFADRVAAGLLLSITMQLPLSLYTASFCEQLGVTITY